MPQDHFGEDVARSYDEDEAEQFAAGAVDPAVDVLADLAGSAGALEFGVGTGRLALPLAARGVVVQGIDLSEAMLARLRGKPGGDRIVVTKGDFAGTSLGRTFGVVYLVFNTIMNLTSQDEQVACFRNAAAHLQLGGCFVVEVGVPDLQRLPRGERIRPFTVAADRLGFDEYDVVGQRLVSHHYLFAGSSVRRISVPFRYVWPAELDLMARLAGLRLRHRWGGWRQEPFTAESTAHVSVWEKPA